MINVVIDGCDDLVFSGSCLRCKCKVECDESDVHKYDNDPIKILNLAGILVSLFPMWYIFCPRKRCGCPIVVRPHKRKKET